MISDSLKCHKCGEKIRADLVSGVAEQSLMKFRISPHPGEFISARTVGGVIENLDKLLTAVGKDLGVKTQVLVKNVSSKKGEIIFDILVARSLPGIHPRKK